MPERKLREIVGDQVLLQVTPETKVHEACRRMGERHVTPALVVDGGALKGIFTKRDLLRRVVVEGRDPAATPITDVMTPDPFCMDCDHLGFEAVRKMRAEKTRHMVVRGLPGGDGYGVVSLRDIRGRELATFERELASEKKFWEEI